MSVYSDSKRLDERSTAPTGVARGRAWPVLTAVLLAIFAVAGLAETAAAQTVTVTTTPSSVATATTPATATQTPQAPATATATVGATTTPVPALAMSPQQGPPGTSVSAKASSFAPGDTIQLLFNGAQVDSKTAVTDGTAEFQFLVPNLARGPYPVVAMGGTGSSAGLTFTIAGSILTLSTQQGPPGSSVTVSGSGFQAGETVDVSFNGALVGSPIADTTGSLTQAVTVPTLAAGQYQIDAEGKTSGERASATFTITGAATATPVAGQPTPTPTPPVGQTAPSVPHDDRYFSQTGYRIDNDAAWSFFQSYGAIETFGFPTSRTFSFLGCPVQFFQRQIIQVCGGAGAALLNILDPGIFPYTKVNGSTFPGPDETMKQNTPPVSDPAYDQKISAFIDANVPNTYAGQPVNFLDYFNSQGSLTIWGAPISNPAPDPNNGNFIYQRFQRGIMHYVQGQGTVSILIADYLKAMILDQNVPPDLRAEAVAQNSPYLKSYCPGAAAWMCKPNQVAGTDYTFAFVPD